MRATLGPVAVVLAVSIGASGCQSSGGMLAWFKRPSSNSTASEAPRYGATAGPVLPSQGQNPANSLTSAPASVWGAGNPAGVVTPTAGTAGYAATGYPANAAAQGAGYPTTGYEQARVGRNVVAPNTTAWNNTAAAPGATAGYGQAPAANAAYGQAGGAAAPGYGVGSATPQGGFNASGYVNPGVGYSAANTAAPGSSPAYGGSPASSATAGQPQNGPYNPAYDGGTPARYASGATIPTATAGDPYAGAVQTANSQPNYRVADARGAASAAAGGGAGATNGAAGDRYANTWGTPAAGDRYAQPAGDYRTAPAGYETGNTGYPAASNPPGNTGYNPPNAYSTSPGAETPGLPARKDPGYRPGGTGDYVPPAGGWISPGAGSQQEPRAQATGVVPASYQSEVGGARLKTATPAAATAPETGGETYGAYQGSSNASSEPAYGAPNPTTLPTTSGTNRW